MSKVCWLDKNVVFICLLWTNIIKYWSVCWWIWFVDSLVSIPLLSPTLHGTLQSESILPGRQTVWLTRNKSVAWHETIPRIHDVSHGLLSQRLECRSWVRGWTILLHQVYLDQCDCCCCKQNHQHCNVHLKYCLVTCPITAQSHLEITLKLLLRFLLGLLLRCLTVIVMMLC